MRLRKILLLIIPILILITLIPQNVFATTSVDLPARVNMTYEWGSGIYSMEAEKNTWVTMRGVKNTTDTYNEDSYDNVAIEPSVGYAYYAAKTLGLNDSDLQSVVSTSDSWNNTTNVKVRDSSQEIDGAGTLYKRSKQYGTVYYGILEDSIRNNKRVFRIKNEDSVKANIKVLADQELGTYTVGPYKLELNVDSNEYTNEAAKILYSELNRTGNEGYSLQNAFAKTNNIGGMNTKEGTNPIFVDEKGKQIIFPDFIPGQEKNFYIRFVPANEGAIVETGNPIINTSYLTKFVAKKFIKGTPASIKFGDLSLKKTKKIASCNFDDSTNSSSDKTEVIEQKESTLKKREYGEPAVVQLDDETRQSMQERFGLTFNIETSAMRKVGEMSPEERKKFYREIQGSPDGLLGYAFDFSHWKDVITIGRNGDITYYYKDDGEFGFREYKNGIETPIYVYDQYGGLTDAHHYDMIAHAYIGKINSNDPMVKEAMNKAAKGIGIRDGTFRPMWLLQEAADQVGSINIITEMGSAQIFYPENITLRQKQSLEAILSKATPNSVIARLNPDQRDTSNFEAGTYNSSTRAFGNWLTSATADDVKADVNSHVISDRGIQIPVKTEDELYEEYRRRIWDLNYDPKSEPEEAIKQEIKKILDDISKMKNHTVEELAGNVSYGPFYYWIPREYNYLLGYYDYGNKYFNDKTELLEFYEEYFENILSDSECKELAELHEMLAYNNRIGLEQKFETVARNMVFTLKRINEDGNNSYYSNVKRIMEKTSLDLQSSIDFAANYYDTPMYKELIQIDSISDELNMKIEYLSFHNKVKQTDKLQTLDQLQSYTLSDLMLLEKEVSNVVINSTGSPHSITEGRVFDFINNEKGIIRINQDGSGRRIGSDSNRHWELMKRIYGDEIRILDDQLPQVIAIDAVKELSTVTMIIENGSCNIFIPENMSEQQINVINKMLKKSSEQGFFAGGVIDKNTGIVKYDFEGSADRVWKEMYFIGYANGNVSQETDLNLREDTSNKISENNKLDDGAENGLSEPKPVDRQTSEINQHENNVNNTEQQTPEKTTQQIEDGSDGVKNTTISKEKTSQLEGSGSVDVTSGTNKSSLVKQAQDSFSKTLDSSGNVKHVATNDFKRALELGADYDSVVSIMEISEVTDDYIYYKLKDTGETVEISKGSLPESQRESIVSKAEGQLKEKNKLYGIENSELQKSLEERRHEQLPSSSTNQGSQVSGETSQQPQKPSGSISQGDQTTSGTTHQQLPSSTSQGGQTTSGTTQQTQLPSGSTSQGGQVSGGTNHYQLPSGSTNQSGQVSGGTTHQQLPSSTTEIISGGTVVESTKKSETGTTTSGTTKLLPDHTENANSGNTGNTGKGESAGQSSTSKGYTSGSTSQIPSTSTTKGVNEVKEVNKVIHEDFINSEIQKVKKGEKTVDEAIKSYDKKVEGFKGSDNTKEILKEDFRDAYKKALEKRDESFVKMLKTTDEENLSKTFEKVKVYNKTGFSSETLDSLKLEHDASMAIKEANNQMKLQGFVGKVSSVSDIEIHDGYKRQTYYLEDNGIVIKEQKLGSNDVTVNIYRNGNNTKYVINNDFLDMGHKASEEIYSANKQAKAYKIIEDSMPTSWKAFNGVNKVLNVVDDTLQVMDVINTVYSSWTKYSNKDKVEGLYSSDMNGNSSNYNNYYNYLLSKMEGRNTVDEGVLGWLMGLRFGKDGNANPNTLFQTIDFAGLRCADILIQKLV